VLNKDTIEQFFSMHDWLKEMFINLPVVEGEMAVERELNSGISYKFLSLIVVKNLFRLPNEAKNMYRLPRQKKKSENNKQLCV
jgi:hypothetical protein